MKSLAVGSLLLLAIPAIAQERPKNVEPPLPAGAVMRLGDTRFRPGVRITHLAFSPDESKLASWGNWLYFEDRLSIWDVTNGKEIFTQSVIENALADVGWGAAGGFAITKSRSGFANWGFADASGKAVKAPDEILEKARSGAPRQVSDGQYYGQIAISADGGRIAAATTTGDAIHVYESKACKSDRELNRIAKLSPGSVSECAGLMFTRGGETLVALNKNGGEQSVVVWDIDKKTASKPFTIPFGVLQGTRQAWDVSADGSALAVGLPNGTIKIFELATGKERIAAEKHTGKSAEVSAVKFVNGGKNVLSAGRDSKQLVWDAKTGADVAKLNGHESWVEAIAVSADGKRVATAGQDSLIRVWDAETWNPVLAPTGAHEAIWRVEVSRDGKYAACGSGDGAHVWELASGREVRSMPADYRSGYILFAPEGGLVAGSKGEKVSLYPLPEGDAKPLNITGRLLDFSPDGKTLVTTTGLSVQIWDWPAGKLRQTVPVKGEVLSGSVAPDNSVVVVGMSEAHTIAVIDLKSGATREIPTKIHWFSHSVGFAAGGRAICGTVGTAQAETFSLGNLGVIRKFDAPAQVRPGHFYQLSISLSPDGRKAATSQSDGGITVYEVATGKILAQFHGHRESAIDVVWTPDGRRILSGGGDHQVLVWDASLATLAKEFDAIAPPGTPSNGWELLGTQPVKEAWRTMATLAAESDATVKMLAEKLKPVVSADDKVVEGIFGKLDDKSFAVRENASRDLDSLGPGAIASVRSHAAKTNSAEVKRRADTFLSRFENDDITPDRLRFLRSLEILNEANTAAAKELINKLAEGASGVWETEAAQQARRAVLKERQRLPRR